MAFQIHGHSWTSAIPGVAAFVLYDAVRVRVIMDVDGNLAIGDAVVVTSDPAHIAQEQLTRAGNSVVHDSRRSDDFSRKLPLERLKPSLQIVNY